MMELSILLVQLIVILVLAHALGWVARKLHQPQVVGEMVAGIVLGPSVCGWALPALSQTLFQPAHLGPLRALSQVGLIIFMFLIGLEFNPSELRGQGRAIAITSYASMASPFLCGVALALALYPTMAGAVPRLHFVLFFATAMSITAFPVLARILAERQLSQSQLGAVALACAAIADVSAWVLLAGVLLFIRAPGEGAPIGAVLGGLAAYSAAMLLGVRRLLLRLLPIYRAHGGISSVILAVVCITVLASSWATEALGIHALFGAFMAGVVLPKDSAFAHALAGKFEGVLALLLPIYFAFTGLASSIGLISGPQAWLTCLTIILVATASKFGGTALAARLVGQPWRMAGGLGILMNARGLMELIILNIGLDMGVISPALFTMMVLMAVVTTVITTPLLALISPRAAEQAGAAEPKSQLAPPIA